MNCTNCNSEIKPNSKFCTSCGQSLKVVNVNSFSDNSCLKCQAALKPGAKFCTSCGTQVSIVTINNSLNSFSPKENDASIAVIKNRIFWNVQTGEIAHLFNESEMAEFDTASGIIINEGTTAYIRANGVQVAEISGGTYDFLQPQKIDDILNERHGGIAGSIKAGFRFLTNLIQGQSIKDKIEDNNVERNPDKLNSIERVVESLKKGQLFSVTLRLNKSFPIIFEIKEIETKILKADFGVHTLFKIQDFKKFSEYFLADTNSVSAEKIMKELMPYLRESIQQVVQDFEIVEERLPEEILNKINQKLEILTADLFHGLQLERIIQISTRSEDLSRFKELSRELYLSEKELGHLVKTNEFQNKLTLTQNSQRLSEARTDADFHNILDSINNSSTKEKLLSQDDMEKFYMTLSREKRIREAKNEEEVNAALLDIEKTGLLQGQDLENLKTSIQENAENHQLQRFHSIALLQINHSIDLDRRQLEWEYEIGDKRIDLEINRRRKELQAEVGYSELEIEKRKNLDEYDRGKKMANEILEIEIQKKKIELELEEQRQREKILENIENRKHEQNIALQAQQIAHQQEMEEKRVREISIKYQASKDLSPEQIMAIAANENLDPLAAQKFAESFSAKNNVESQKEFMAQFNKLNDARIQDSKDMMERMERMYNKGLDTSSSMTGHLINLKNKEKDEYKNRLERQEDRMDKTQDKALDYTTRNNKVLGREMPPPPGSDYFVNLPGQEKYPKNLKTIISMIKNGQIERNTKIYSHTIGEWISAENIEELSSHFFGTSSSKSFEAPNYLRCRNCGSDQLEADTRFCPECGNEP